MSCALSLAVTPALAQDTALNDYPTVARADYVFGCMAANGQTRTALEQCACSIDHIATVLSYDRYVQAETILRTVQVGGERVAAFRGSARHKEMVADLRRAQAEADIVCF
ncbi:MAG: hypothetical protein AAF713_14520 [Pseudomonadota bacterium]